MKRILIASLFSLAAAPVFASVPNDFPEQGKLEASRAAALKASDLPQPSFNDQADLDTTKVNVGVAGRSAAEIGQAYAVLSTPAY
jgi:hypothetical protein